MSLQNRIDYRCIVHVDMDAFFASVEQLERPELKGKPVVVGAVPGRRGVVSSASYEARKFGVRSAMPVSEAKRLCPHGIFVPVNGKLYSRYSERLVEIFESYTPLLEVASIDEAYLDLTGCPVLSKSKYEIGIDIKSNIKGKTGLTASVGIASNKFVAKIASDLNKPDGLVIVNPGDESDFLKNLKVDKLFGVGEKSARILKSRGLHTAGDIQRLTMEFLVREFGNFGKSLYYMCRGIDDRPIECESQAKSMGKEVTFETDVSDADILMSALARLSQEVGTNLRKHGLWGKCVILKLRYSDFNTITRSVSFDNSVNQDHVIFDYAKQLFNKIVLTAKVRLLGITLSKLEKFEDKQFGFFEENSSTKQQKLYESIDKIRGKYGKKSLILGKSLDTESDS